MDSKQLLKQIFNSQKVSDKTGKEYELNSNLDEKEGEFITQIIRENSPQKTIEIGCAYGISSLYICSSIDSNAFHTIIDPFQSSDWNNIGVSNLKRADFRNFELIEKPSEIALPNLFSENQKYDFAFIDGWHTFDHTLIDFFYINKMLNIGGIIVIDDTGLPSINKLMRYILEYPAYQIIGSVEVNVSKKRAAFDFLVKSPFTLLSKFFPTRIKHEIFDNKVIKSDKKMNLNSSMIALKKISEDNRPWNWFENF